MRLLDTLFGKRSRLGKPETVEEPVPEAQDYPDLFEAACRRTRDLALGADPPFPRSSATMLDDRFMERLLVHSRNVIEETLGGRVENMAGQCFNVNIELARRLSGDGLDVALTWGSVYNVNRGRLFGIETADVGSLVRQGVGRVKLDMHCWLTLPGRQIVDTTLMTTVAQVSGHRELVGDVIIGDAVAQPNYRYLPQLVGGHFPIRAGLVVGFKIFERKDL